MMKKQTATKLSRNKIYALFDSDVIRVYQAYSDVIANEALKLGTFGALFKMDRMTWIKPSFLWMMYRSGWATKEGQNRILAIDMKRKGFDFIVNNSVLTAFSKEIYTTHEHWNDMLKKSNIRCQWDPDRDIYGNPQEQRTIQLGIKGDIVEKYVSEWIVEISDITKDVISIDCAIKEKSFNKNMLPHEYEYPL